MQRESGSRLVTTVERLGDLEHGALALAGAGAATLVATFLLFVLEPGLVAYGAIAFVATTAIGWVTYESRTATALMFVATVSTVAILGLITVYLFQQAFPVFVHMGSSAFLGTEAPYWRVSGDVYKLTPMIHGTVVTTLIATVIAGVLGVGGAVYISEIAPEAVREVVKPGIEILAGIPSIVYGFIGYVIVNSYMTDVFEISGYGTLLVAGTVIGLMALPTVASVAEDALASVPDHVKDGALAMGATEWQTITSVTLPAALSGVSAAVLLGVGRAIGETMAATVILGNVANRFPEPLYDVFGNGITLTSLVASQYGNAHGLHMRALFAAGVTLFVTVTVLSLGAQFVETRMRRKLGGEL